MPKLILGFVAGFVAAFVVQRWVSQPPAVAVISSAPLESSDMPVSAISSGTKAVPASGPQASTPTTIKSTEPKRSSSDPSAGDERASDTAAANPITLPDTHAGFVTKSRLSMPDMHAEIEREDADFSWAPIAEDLLTRYLTTHAESQSIVIAALNCRTTRCELAGTVYGETPGELWRSVRQGLSEQTWYGEYFDGSSSEAGGNQPGEYRFVTIIPRVGTRIEPPVEQ